MNALQTRKCNAFSHLNSDEDASDIGESSREAGGKIKDNDRAQWKVGNARLLAFGLWLLVGVWVLGFICEMGN